MDIAVALGGGGSRGFAHVGVLRCLEQNGFTIRAAAGTSAGAIIAAMYADGYAPDEMERRFIELDQTKLFGRVSGDGAGLLGLSGAEKVLVSYFGDRTFDKLKIPCAVVSVDINRGVEVVLNQGCVVDAIMASVAVPGIFPPKERGDAMLVDGAVLNPVPVSVARRLVPDLPVIAVILDKGALPDNGFPNIPLRVAVPDRIVKSLTHTRVAQSFNIFLKSVDIGSRKMAELRLQVDDPDGVIAPDAGEIGILDKVEVQKVIQIGWDAAERAIPEIKRKLAWPNQLRRRIFTRRA